MTLFLRNRSNADGALRFSSGFTLDANFVDMNLIARLHFLRTLVGKRLGSNGPMCDEFGVSFFNIVTFRPKKFEAVAMKFSPVDFEKNCRVKLSDGSRGSYQNLKFCALHVNFDEADLIWNLTALNHKV